MLYIRSISCAVYSHSQALQNWHFVSCKLNRLASYSKTRWQAFPSIWFRFISIFLLASQFPIFNFSARIFDGVFPRARRAVGHNNNLSSSTWVARRKVSKTTPLVAAQYLQKAEEKGKKNKQEGLAKYPLAFAKSVKRKGPLVNTLWCARLWVRVWLPASSCHGSEASADGGMGRARAEGARAAPGIIPHSFDPQRVLDIYFELAFSAAFVAAAVLASSISWVAQNTRARNVIKTFFAEHEERQRQRRQQLDSQRLIFFYSSSY